MHSFPVTRSEAGGIPVLTAQLPVAYTGRLTFGVGKRDETARTAGVAHLVEHLVMMRVGRVSVAHNAVTGEDELSFFAQGSPAQAADFLHRVAEAIRTLDQITDRDVARQRKTIVSELGEDDEKTGRGPLLDRFGTSSLGLLDLGQPAHRTHTREMVLEFAARWLHAGNAALSFSGAVPEDLDIVLPPARPVERVDAPEPLPGRTTGWVSNLGVQAAFSLIVTGRRPARNAFSWVLEETLYDELRTEANLIYSTATHFASIGPDRRHIAFLLDPAEQDVERTAVAATAILRRLAADGPDVSVLEHVRTQFAGALQDPAMHLDALESSAVELARTGASDASIDSIADVTVDELRDIAAAALPTLLWSLGIETMSDEGREALSLPDVSRHSELADLGKSDLFKRLMKGDVLSPRFRKGPRGAQLIADDERIAIVHPDGIIDVAFREIALAGVCSDCGHWDLTAVDGDGMIFRPEAWRGADKVVRRLEARVPVELRYTLSEDADAVAES